MLMLAPLAPHFAEESWERLGHGSSVFDARWPRWDEGVVAAAQGVRKVVYVANRLLNFVVG